MTNENAPQIINDFSIIQPLEHQWIKQRREKVEKNGYGNPEQDATGLGLSGGGIRSAIFNLGLLQALDRYKVMPRIDYLSTVSGGGYIGACYTWLKQLLPDASPFGTSRSDFNGTAAESVAWMRAHGKYLTAGHGLSGWSLTAAIINATLSNLLVIIPVMLLVFYGLTRQIDLPPVIDSFLSPVIHFTQGGDDGFAMILLLGLISLASFTFLMFVYMSTTALSVCRKLSWQRNMRRLQGMTLMYGVFFIVAGTVPLIHQYITEIENSIILAYEESNSSSQMRYLMSYMSESTTLLAIVSGVMSMVFGGLSSKKSGAKQSQGMMFMNIGLSLLVYGMFLFFYELMKEPNAVSESVSLADSSWFWGALVFSVYLAIFGNVNMISIHRYYRNRLMEAFMPRAVVAREKNDTSTKPDHCKIYRASPSSDAPFQIINTTVNMTGSKNSKYQGRGGDNFVFTPLHCGAASTGYMPSDQFAGNTIDLATAVAISGAAVNPNSSVTRSRPLSFVMTLLNLRLGYWIRNPKFPAAFNGFFSRPWWYIYMIRELFGRGLNESFTHVHLADGGHFENLGLYELVRRRCRLIIISDAGADPDFDFGDLAKAIELVRLDFGAKVTLFTDDLVPQGERRLSKSAFAIGSIEYIDCDVPAKLIYIKTAVTAGLPEDIYGYRRQNPAFPDESTADQFFDETQFEAYRELGFQTGKNLCAGELNDEMDHLFLSAASRIENSANTDGLTKVKVSLAETNVEIIN